MKTALAFVLVAMVIFWVVEDGDCYKRILRTSRIRRPKAPRNNLNKRFLACDDVRGRGRGETGEN